MLHTIVFAAMLSGTVVMHHQTGAEELVGAALVELRGLYPSSLVMTAMTATDGTFTIPDVAPGEYLVKVTANQGGMGGSVRVSRSPADPPRTFYLFDPTCGARFGRVFDSDTGEPIAGAEVDYLAATRTDATGDYFISLGCFSGPGFQFHNSFFFGAAADGYRRVSYFGGRAEYASGGVFDFELKPLAPPRRGRLRPIEPH